MTTLVPGPRLIDLRNVNNWNGSTPVPSRVPMNLGAQPSSWRLCCRLSIGNTNLRHIREYKPQSSTVHTHFKSLWHGVCKATHAGDVADTGAAPDTSGDKEPIGDLQEGENAWDGEEDTEEKDPEFRVTDVFDSEGIEGREREEFEEEAKILAARYEAASRDEIPPG